MKKALKIASVLFLLFVVAPMVYSVFDPYIIWYFLDFHSHILVDGKPTHGRVHRAHDGNSLFVTLPEGDKAITYMVLVPREGGGHVRSCGDWVAPRFPVDGSGDLNPPCWSIRVAENPSPGPAALPRNLVVGRNFVEFIANDGKRVRATW